MRSWYLTKKSCAARGCRPGRTGWRPLRHARWGDDRKSGRGARGPARASPCAPGSRSCSDGGRSSDRARPSASRTSESATDRSAPGSGRATSRASVHCDCRAARKSAGSPVWMNTGIFSRAAVSHTGSSSGSSSLSRVPSALRREPEVLHDLADAERTGLDVRLELCRELRARSRTDAAEVDRQTITKRLAYRLSRIAASWRRSASPDVLLAFAMTCSPMESSCPRPGSRCRVS